MEEELKEKEKENGNEGENENENEKNKNKKENQKEEVEERKSIFRNELKPVQEDRRLKKVSFSRNIQKTDNLVEEEERGEEDDPLPFLIELPEVKSNQL